MGQLWFAGLPLELIIPLCLVLGAVLGAVNGFLVTRLGLPSLAVTIGTLALYRGLAFVVLGDQRRRRLPAVLDRLGAEHASARPASRSSSSRCWCSSWSPAWSCTPPRSAARCYAMGNSEDAARFSGIGVGRTKFWLFVVTGVVARARRHVLDAALRQRPRGQRPGPGAAGHRRHPARRRVHLRRQRRPASA